MTTTTNENIKRLTIFVASYNLENYIEECLDSLLKQSYPHAKIVVVDDGSTDSTLSILDSYAKRGDITLYCKENGGTGNVRNFMLNHIDTEFFTFVDGDDVIADDCYLANMHLFDDQQIDVVQYPILFGWTSLREDKKAPEPRVLNDKKEMFDNYLYQDITFCMCDKIYRSSAFGNLKFREGVFYEDVDSNLQVLSMARKMAIADQGLYYYRRTANSNITRAMTFKKMHDYFTVIFNFVHAAQQGGATPSKVAVYLSRWLRNDDFLAFESFDEDQKQNMLECVRQVDFSKLHLFKLLLTSKLSIRKYQALSALASGDINMAIKLSVK